MVNKAWRDVKSSAQAGLKRSLKVKNLQANLKDASNLLMKKKIGKAASRVARGVALDFLDDGEGERGKGDFGSLQKKAMSKYGKKLLQSGAYEGKRQLSKAMRKYGGANTQATSRKVQMDKPLDKPLYKSSKNSQLKLL